MRQKWLRLHLVTRVSSGAVELRSSPVQISGKINPIGLFVHGHIYTIHGHQDPLHTTCSLVCAG